MTSLIQYSSCSLVTTRKLTREWYSIQQVWQDMGTVTCSLGPTTLVSLFLQYNFLKRAAWINYGLTLELVSNSATSQFMIYAEILTCRGELRCQFFMLSLAVTRDHSLLVSARNRLMTNGQIIQRWLELFATWGKLLIHLRQTTSKLSKPLSSTSIPVYVLA